MAKKPGTKTEADGGMPDLSERADGPALIALWGDDDAGNEFRLGTREYDWHSHLRGQVFCVESGLVHVRTAHGSWLLPPHRAGWLPPGEAHKVSISGAMSGWSVLITPQASHELPTRPCVIGISELMRALVRRAVTWTGQAQLDAEQERMIAVLLDEMRRAPHEPLHLPMPTDRRLLRIATAIYAQPEDGRTMDEWARWAGLSARTLSRLFLAETSVSFAQWRQQARLVHALERLARGEAVADIADALGYATPSNFIAMFRRSFGESPARYFASRAALH
ncbi:AraC family transcriptional regulator [Variovorax sp. VaC1]|uniref:AraC family transcriptional regulator n=1 Tax=Variovorax sp. VaC1 TaxID=3373132 RepID=UPI003747E6D7